MANKKLEGKGGDDWCYLGWKMLKFWRVVSPVLLGMMGIKATD